MICALIPQQLQMMMIMMMARSNRSSKINRYLPRNLILKKLNSKAFKTIKEGLLLIYLDLRVDQQLRVLKYIREEPKLLAQISN